MPVVGTTSKEIYLKPITENTEELPAVSAPSAITGAKPSPAEPQKGEDSATKLRQHVKNIQQAINVGKELREAVKMVCEIGAFLVSVACNWRMHTQTCPHDAGTPVDILTNLACLHSDLLLLA